MVWNPDVAELEAPKIKYEIVEYTRGNVLDLGCGFKKTFPHFIGVDGAYTEDIRPDILMDAKRLDIFASASMDAVFSSHLLEHIEEPYKALREWWRVIKPGGYLVLYLPHKDFYPNIGEDGANPDHEHDFLPEDIIDMMKKIGYWDLVRNESRNHDDEYSFFQVYKKKLNKHRFSYEDPKPKKTVCVCRYGGFGDMIQMSSILPELKKDGYHITVMTTPKGQNIVKHNPYIDRFIIQDTEQVPNLELPVYWGVQAKRFDRFINLSETVEGAFLAIPGRPKHTWPHNIRDKYLDVNYHEFLHEYAKVDFSCGGKFYPVPHERNWAKRQVKHIDGKVILWVLDGSSPHKTWPYLDQALMRILTDGNNEIFLTGGVQSVILEQGWEKEPRVHKTSGKWDIRQTLAFLDVCDMVIGPETGVLNAGAFMEIPKIIFLSHSSKENLTKHWKNTVSLTPENCECYPCHMLHYGTRFCNMDEKWGVADCQMKISLDVFWKAYKEVL